MKAGNKITATTTRVIAAADFIQTSRRIIAEKRHTVLINDSNSAVLWSLQYMKYVDEQIDD